MSALTERERVATLLFYAFVLLLAYAVFLLFRPFLAPLAWAAVVVTVSYPVHARFERRWGPTRGAILSTLLVAFILVVPTLLLAVAFVNESVQAVSEIRRVFDAGGFAWLQGAWDMVQQRLPVQVGDLATVANDVAKGAAGFIVGQVGSILQNAALLVVDLAVMLFATFFFFRDAPAMVAAVRNALPFESSLRDRMIEQTEEVVSATVVSSMIVAVVQGVLGGLAFAVLGLPAPVFWGVVMAVLCLLPLGAWVVWAPAALWLVTTGHVGRGIALAVFGAGIVGAVDNFLRPILLGGRTRMNGLLVFVALLGGVSAFGLLGVVLGPLLMATGVGLVEAYTSRPERPVGPEASADTAEPEAD